MYCTVIALRYTSEFVHLDKTSLILKVLTLDPKHTITSLEDFMLYRKNIYYNITFQEQHRQLEPIP